jgi:preprotein translocase subunit SecG
MKMMQKNVIAALTRKPAMTPVTVVLYVAFLFISIASFAATAAYTVETWHAAALQSGQSWQSGQRGLLPSETDLLEYNNEGELPSQTSFGGSEKQKDLLFAPGGGPPQDGIGGGDAVGEEAPVRECAWIFLLCCLTYGFFCRNLDNPDKSIKQKHQTKTTNK